MTVAEKRDAQRNRLVDAAADVVRAAGAASLKVRDLAAAAGCSTGQVYTHFEDMDALIVAVNSRTIASLAAHLDARSGAGADADPTASLVSLALAYLEFAVTRPREWGALFERAAISGKAAPEWHRDEHRALVARIASPLATLAPEATADEVAELSLTMFSMVHGIVVIGLQDLVVSVPADRLSRQLRVVVEATCRGLRR